jgi:activator of HSP90 ATPase
MTFSSGNYNEFETLVRVKIPATSEIIRNNLLPKIEATLKQMLKSLNDVKGKFLNVTPEADSRGLKGFLCQIEYEVQDFAVPEAPKKAIEEDVESISKAISTENAHLKKVSINTTNGVLSILYEIPVEEL